MKPIPEPRHDLSPMEIDAVEVRLYEYNRAVTGRGDGAGLGFVLRDEAGRMIGAAAGYSWAGISELKQMWVDEAYRGQGYGRALLEAFVAEAQRRGVRRVWVASYDFQAPGLYERLGFVRMAEFEGWPDGHVNVILCKTFPAGDK
jgi:ribosomal protein S18 acetylase RimI-like enzyme